MILDAPAYCRQAHLLSKIHKKNQNQMILMSKCDTIIPVRFIRTGLSLYIQAGLNKL